MESMHDHHESGDHSATITDRVVHNEKGTKLGKVVDVLFDDETQEPAWAIVKTGALGGVHYVPLTWAYETANGNVVVPYDKETIKNSPKARRDHYMSDGDKAEVGRYYGTKSTD